MRVGRRGTGRERRAEVGVERGSKKTRANADFHTPHRARLLHRASNAHAHAQNSPVVMTLPALRQAGRAALAGRRGESERDEEEQREREERAAARARKKKLNPLPPFIHSISLGFAAAVNYLKSGSPPGSDAAGPTPAWAADLAHPPATAFELRRRAAAAGEAFPADKVRKKRERERERERVAPHTSDRALGTLTHAHAHACTHRRPSCSSWRPGRPSRPTTR